MGREEILVTKDELLRIVNSILRKSAWPQCAAQDIEQIPNATGGTTLRITKWLGTAPRDPGLVNLMILSGFDRVLISEDKNVPGQRFAENWRSNQYTPWRLNEWKPTKRDPWDWSTDL